MTERERLIELINKARDEYPTVPLVNGCKPIFTEFLTEQLLSNGVIVPPVKVGQTVWRVDDCIECVAVDKVVIKHGGIYMKLSCNSMYETSCRSIGKTVFLTKEEAERELERRNNEIN